MTPVYKEDGVDHIRLHLQGATDLGRRLNEFCVRPFSVEGYAEFNHLLGYSLYLQSGCRESRFRYLSPTECFKISHGMTLERSPHFNREYAKGLLASLYEDRDLRSMLLESRLPLLSYKETPGDTVQPFFVDYYRNYRIANVT